MRAAVRLGGGQRAVGNPGLSGACPTLGAGACSVWDDTDVVHVTRGLPPGMTQTDLDSSGEVLPLTAGLDPENDDPPGTAYAARASPG